MIPLEFDYSAPATLQEALELLAEEEAKPLAGGCSLIPLLKLRLAAPGRLVDLSRIPELRSIAANSGSIHAGAMATHYDLESSSLLRAACPLLAETASHIGDVQVRNMGTLGGSVAHNDPAADYPAALFALEAQVRLRSKDSERMLPLSEFLVDALITAAEPGELVTEIIVPAEQPGTGASYQKMRNPASGFALVGVAARMRKTDGIISMARVGVTGLAAIGFRAVAVEQLLEGTAGSAADIKKAAAVIADGVEANSDIHASANYRKHVAAVYAARAITAALERSS